MPLSSKLHETVEEILHVIEKFLILSQHKLATMNAEYEWPHRLIYRDAWSLGSGTPWQGLGGVVFWEEVCPGGGPARPSLSVSACPTLLRLNTTPAATPPPG